jgi:Trypsin-like peptidase domain
MKCIPAILAVCAAPMAGLLAIGAASVWPARPPRDADLDSAICPVVYPLDESSSARGYHYIFYGNAFFVNKDGYLITAAHVLSDLKDGVEPHLMLQLPEAPPRIVKAEVVATDPQHDIAILQVKPNPFAGKYKLSYLSLAATKPALGAAVLAAALRPSRLKDPYSFEAFQEDYSPAEVIQYAPTPLFNGQVAVELFLFNHEVLRGQSGAPVVSKDDQKAVVGIVEGRWLHPAIIRGTRHGKSNCDHRGSYSDYLCDSAAGAGAYSLASENTCGSFAVKKMTVKYCPLCHDQLAC